MEAILVFDLNNYLIYSNHNKEFLKNICEINISKNFLNLDLNANITSYLQNNYQEYCNLIVLLLGPYVASLRILKLDCPKVNIFNNQKIKILNQSYLDFIFIYLFEENDQIDLNERIQKLDYFVLITKFFFGVSIQRLENHKLQKSYLNITFDCWKKFQNFSLFKLKAVERLIVNEKLYETFHKMLANFIEEISLNIESFFEEIPFQAFIYVNDMILSSYKRPNSPKILNMDLILITLLVKTHFYSSNLEQNNSINLAYDHPNENIQKNQFINNFEIDLNYLFKNDFPKNLDGLKEKSSLHSINSNCSNNHLFTDCIHQLIFLHSYIDKDNLIPFYIRFIRINKEILFVCISELPSTFLYFYTNNLLKMLNGILYYDSNYFGFTALSNFEMSIKKMKKCLDFIISSFKNNKKKISVAKNLRQKLDKLIKSDFRKYLIKTDELELTAYLDAILSSISFLLKELADIMIYSHHHNQLIISHHFNLIRLKEIKKRIIYQLRDYFSYLWVKNRRNIPIEPYKNLINNLVMFLYIDRSANEFIWTSDENFSLDFNLKHKSKLTIENLFKNFVDTAYKNLQKGNIQYRHEDEKYIYNYVIMFEDISGKTLNCKKKFTLRTLPNIYSNNFIEEIANQAFPDHKFIICTDINENMITKTVHSNKNFCSILRCHEIFYITDSNNLPFNKQKDFFFSKISNEEKFLIGDCFNNFDLIQAKRLVKKILETITITKKNEFNQT